MRVITLRSSKATTAAVPEVKRLETTVGACSARMPSRRKQQKPRHVDADEGDDVQTRPQLDDEHDDDDDAGKST